MGHRVRVESGVLAGESASQILDKAYFFDAFMLYTPQNTASGSKMKPVISGRFPVAIRAELGFPKRPEITHSEFWTLAAPSPVGFRIGQNRKKSGLPEPTPRPPPKGLFRPKTRYGYPLEYVGGVFLRPFGG